MKSNSNQEVEISKKARVVILRVLALQGGHEIKFKHKKGR